MTLLEGDSTIKRWERCRSLRIPYTKANGKRGHYNPDFIVEREEGTKELHEVKGGHLLTNEETKRKLAAGEAFRTGLAGISAGGSVSQREGDGYA